MKKTFVASAMTVALATVANADWIRLYFGQPEYVTAAGDFVPDHGAPLPAGQPGATVTVGLWAVPAFDWASPPDVWQTISLNVLTTGDVTCDSIVMDNSDHHPTPFITAYRWESDSDFGGTDGSLSLNGRQTYGLGGLLPAELEVTPADAWSYVDGGTGGVIRYWLGNVTLTSHGGAGEVFLQIGEQLIYRRGGDPFSDPIYLGLDDDPGLLGYQFGATTATPEYRFIPEPAAVVLLSAAGFLLHRRR